MTETPSHRQPLDRAVMAHICDAAVPDSTILRVRRLGGGLDAGMDRVELALHDGGRQSVVVRRWGAEQLARDPCVVARVWQVLGLLERAGISAPRPVFLDEGGELAGCPLLVMSLVPGRGNLNPRNSARWAAELAQALAAIHRASLDDLDAGLLRKPGAELASLLSDDQPSRDAAACIDRPRIRSVIHARLEALSGRAPVFTHGDYWAGNTLWRRDRLTGVVDWDDAALDDPGIAVGYCRLDLALMRGDDTPDLFVRAYERAIGAPIDNLWLYDLLAALRVPADPGVWLPGYHELGRTEVTGEQMRARLRAFTADALDRAAQA